MKKSGAGFADAAFLICGKFDQLAGVLSNPKTRSAKGT